MAMKNDSALFTSKRQEWETPQRLFDELNNKYHFELDAAASSSNAKVKNYFTEEDNSLIQNWERYTSVFVNPPYTSQLQNDFIKKAYETWKNFGTTVVLLIPARTDTLRWHKYIFPYAKKIKFLKGRLKFESDGEPGGTAPFPSAVVIFSN